MTSTAQISQVEFFSSHTERIGLSSKNLIEVLKAIYYITKNDVPYNPVKAGEVKTHS